MRSSMIIRTTALATRRVSSLALSCRMNPDQSAQVFVLAFHNCGAIVHAARSTPIAETPHRGSR